MAAYRPFDIDDYRAFLAESYPRPAARRRLALRAEARSWLRAASEAVVTVLRGPLRRAALAQPPRLSETERWWAELALRLEARAVQVERACGLLPPDAALVEVLPCPARRRGGAR